MPADVDPATGYRRYRRDQLQMARAVAALRDLELSIPAIRALLEADDPATRATILQDERVRLEARTARLQRALHRLHMLSITADQRAAAPPSPDAGDADPAPSRLPHPTLRGPVRADPAAAPHPRPRDAPRARRRAVQPLLGPARARGPDRPPGRRAHRHRARLRLALAPGRQRRQRGARPLDARPGVQRARPRRPRPSTTPVARTRSSTRAARASRTGTGPPPPRRWPARSWRSATWRARPSGRRGPPGLLDAVADADDRGVVEGDLAALPV